MKFAIWKRQNGISNIPATSGTEARNGPEKRPMKMPSAPHFLMKASPLRDQVRIFRQRPDVLHGVFELPADPVGQPVAQRGADRTGDPDRPEIEVARTDQRADQDQRSPGRNQQRNERQRFHEREREHDRRGPDLMEARKIDDRLDVLFKHFLENRLRR
nr:MetaGeneMark_Unknown Function [uncultured bacterium]